MKMFIFALPICDCSRPTCLLAKYSSSKRDCWLEKLIGLT